MYIPFHKVVVLALNGHVVWPYTQLYVHSHTYIYPYIHTTTFIYVHTCMHPYIYFYAFMYIQICVQMYMHLSTFLTWGYTTLPFRLPQAIRTGASCALCVAPSPCWNLRSPGPKEKRIVVFGLVNCFLTTAAVF